MLLHNGPLDVRLVALGRVEEGRAGQLHQVGVTGLAHGQQRDAPREHGLGFALERLEARLVLGPVLEIDGERAANDRLDAGARQLVGKFQRAEQIVGVGNGQRRLLITFRQLGEFADRQRALEQRVGRMHFQMHEAWRFGGGA